MVRLTFLVITRCPQLTNNQTLVKFTLDKLKRLLLFDISNWTITEDVKRISFNYLLLRLKGLVVINENSPETTVQFRLTPVQFRVSSFFATVDYLIAEMCH